MPNQFRISFAFCVAFVVVVVVVVSQCWQCRQYTYADADAPLTHCLRSAVYPCRENWSWQFSCACGNSMQLYILCTALHNTAQAILISRCCFTLIIMSSTQNLCYYWWTLTLCATVNDRSGARQLAERARPRNPSHHSEDNDDDADDSDDSDNKDARWQQVQTVRVRCRSQTARTLGTTSVSWHSAQCCVHGFFPAKSGFLLALTNTTLGQNRAEMHGDFQLEKLIEWS